MEHVAIIGSQEVPYIYEDRTNKEQFFSALNKMMGLGKKGRKEMVFDMLERRLVTPEQLNKEYMQ